MGKLIVIEGTDGSGKSTQFGLLSEHLQKDGVEFKHLVFPRYSEPSSALIRMYLGGEFGTKPTDVNAYAASAFYAVDRYASYKMDWGNWYEESGLQWLYDFEYDKLGLPSPDLVIYLDVPTDYTEKMLRSREQATNTQADIHEQDMQYLATCRKTGKTAAEYYGWKVIECVRNGEMRTREDIHAEIFAAVQECLEEK